MKVDQSLVGKKVFCKDVFDIFSSNGSAKTKAGEIIDTFEDKHLQGYVILWENKQVEQVYKHLVHEEKSCRGVGIYYKN